MQKGYVFCELRTDILFICLATMLHVRATEQFSTVVKLFVCSPDYCIELIRVKKKWRHSVTSKASNDSFQTPTRTSSHIILLYYIYARNDGIIQTEIQLTSIGDTHNSVWCVAVRLRNWHAKVILTRTLSFVIWSFEERSPPTVSVQCPSQDKTVLFCIRHVSEFWFI